MPEAVLEVRNLKKHSAVGGAWWGWGQGWVKAVDGVTFTIHASETLGLVGESGCDKTTTSKLLLAAEEPTAGVIAFEGRELVHFSAKELTDYRRKVQGVFQDSYSSLSPRVRVGEIIGEPIVTHERLSRRDVRGRVAELLERVGLRPDMVRLFPHEFSGGQRQRLAIACALSTHAQLIVLDEPVSAVDVSIGRGVHRSPGGLLPVLGSSPLATDADGTSASPISPASVPQCWLMWPVDSGREAVRE